MPGLGRRDDRHLHLASGSRCLPSCEAGALTRIDLLHADGSENTLLGLAGWPGSLGRLISLSRQVMIASGHFWTEPTYFLMAYILPGRLLEPVPAVQEGPDIRLARLAAVLQRTPAVPAVHGDPRADPAAVAPREPPRIRRQADLACAAG
jgi:hypothetical protein